MDRPVEASENSDLWDHFPHLTAVSIGLAIWELWQRHQRGEISRERFKWMAAQVAGVKIGKIGLLVLAMTIPGLNVVVGAGLVVGLLFSGASMVKAVVRCEGHHEYAALGKKDRRRAHPRFDANGSIGAGGSGTNPAVEFHDLRN